VYGPSLSPIGGGLALTTPTRRRLGRPLPYQQADATQAAQRALANFTWLLYPSLALGDYRELPSLSAGYARLFGAYLRITTSSAGFLWLAPRDPLTCMPYPRR
jgi:hypothetical protein